MATPRYIGCGPPMTLIRTGTNDRRRPRHVFAAGARVGQARAKSKSIERHVDEWGERWSKKILVVSLGAWALWFYAASKELDD